MDFALTPQQTLARQLFREFAENEVKPLAAEIDEQERFPSETIEKMAKLGLMGIHFPKEFGGQGGDVISYVLCIEEMARVCATTAVILSVHSLPCDIISKNGTPEQKARFLPDLLSGKVLGAFALTEPGAGSDAAGQQTKAVLDGDQYILNGTKVFITNGGYAGLYGVFAMTDKSRGTKGISTFLVEAGTPGFSIGKKELKMGIRGSSTTELIFENCAIPKENIIGPEGKGFFTAMSTLDSGRIGIAAQALGIAQGAFDEAVSYVKERKQFGKPLAQFQNTRFVIADMKARIEAARFLVYNAAWLKQTGQDFGPAASMAKLFASDVAMDVTTKVVQIFGGYGYTRDYPVERMMRDAKITQLYEGTSEVQRMVIANSVLK
ncbi:acyl-CoA dehydrogenase [Desulfovibrio sp. OttesenSCG-928-C14]|nr:acyl-CoA dehydrogenase [Desulfovibrio sp. OttesenSCG-928-C14]